MQDEEEELTSASAAASSPRLSPTVHGTRTHHCPEIPELGLFSVEMMAGEEGGRRGAREEGRKGGGV